MYKYKLIAPLLLFFIPLCYAAEYRYNLAICAIFQDEAPYLKEWIEFHRLVGVEHFYLYNNRSRDNYREVLKPYILSGLVEVIDKPKVANRIKVFNRLQCKCYNECLAHARGVSKWVAFIDIDEFLFPVNERSLLSVLKQYEGFGGVYANWRIFGTSHIRHIPKSQLLIETLTLCTKKSFPANLYVKSIVRPEYAVNFPNPHHPIYRPGYCQVNTNKVPFEGPFLSTYIQDNKLRINHYWTRDEDFFYRIKIPRQKKWGGDPNAQQILQGSNTEKDEAILRFVPDLKKAMGMQ
jgi:hypothetical protein